jgi:uncharacterized protein YcbX
VTAARVVWLSLTPVKGTRLHHPNEVDLLETGVRGDRRFYIVTESGRLVNDKTCGALQLVHADYDEHHDVLTMRFPDGEEVSAPVERGAELETTFHSRQRHARVVAGPWADHLAAVVGEPVLLVEPPESGVDRGHSGAATLVSVGSLAALAGVLGVESVDGRRFRMNVGIEGISPHEEDAWLGRRVRIGEAVVVPEGNVGRCAVTTQNPDTGRPDLDTLEALASYRGELETTEPLAFGVHAAVVAPGRVRVGDAVAPL